MNPPVIKILTIDDEEVIRSGFRRFLEDLNYVCLEAENGRKGLEVFHREKPDLILIDLRMPEMDGLEVLRQIQNESPETPVIVVSGTGRVGDVIESLRTGAWDYLHKPIDDLTIIKHAISRALERSQLLRENKAYQERLESLVAQKTEALRQTARALEQSEKKYRLLVEHASDVICSILPDGCITFLSESVKRLGYDPAVLIGHKISEFLHQEDKEKFIRAIEQIEFKSSPAPIECRLRNGTDGYLWIEITMEPVLEEGSLMQINVVIRPINERKNAEHILLQERLLLHTLVNNLPDAVYIKDAQSRKLLANRADWENAGLRNEQEILGKNDFDLYPEEVASRFYADDQHIILTGQPIINREELVTNNSNQKRWLLTSKLPLHDPSGAVIGILGIGRDITDRKRSEELLKLNESRLEALLRLNHMTGVSKQALAIHAMEEAVRLTQSTLGYIAFLNEDESVLHMHAWSRTAMKECLIETKPLLYPVETTGLWGEAVRQRKPIVTNDYSLPNPLKKGYPEGHVTIIRHMNVPIFDTGKIVVVAGVGNKPEDYDDTDVQQLTLLMEGMWRVHQRNQSEKALRECEEQNRKIVKTTPEGIWIINDPQNK